MQSLTIEQASKQNRLALRKTCGALASGTRVSVVSSADGVFSVEKQVDVVKHDKDNREISRQQHKHHELVTADDLIVLRRRVRLSIF